MLMFPLLSCSLYRRTLETVEKATQLPHGDTALQQIWSSPWEREVGGGMPSERCDAVTEIQQEFEKLHTKNNTDLVLELKQLLWILHHRQTISSLSWEQRPASLWTILVLFSFFSATQSEKSKGTCTFFLSLNLRKLFLGTSSLPHTCFLNFSKEKKTCLKK